MLEQLLPLIAGGAGGLVGGNVTGALFRKAGVGLGSSSIVGIAAGALATHFFGPTIGPIVAGLVGTGDIGSIVGNAVTGLGGGGIGTIVWGIIRSLISK